MNNPPEDTNKPPKVNRVVCCVCMYQEEDEDKMPFCNYHGRRIPAEMYENAKAPIWCEL